MTVTGKKVPPEPPEPSVSAVAVSLSTHPEASSARDSPRTSASLASSCPVPHTTGCTSASSPTSSPPIPARTGSGCRPRKAESLPGRRPWKKASTPCSA